MDWLKGQCRVRLQPAWQPRKIKNAMEFDPLSLLGAADREDRVTVLQLVDSSGFPNHCVAIANGWIFDTNKQRALPLCEIGLDACCLGDARFKHVLAGFHLVRSAHPRASSPTKRQQGAENGSPNSPKSKKARKAA